MVVFASCASAAIVGVAEVCLIEFVVRDRGASEGTVDTERMRTGLVDCDGRAGTCSRGLTSLGESAGGAAAHADNFWWTLHAEGDGGRDPGNSGSSVTFRIQSVASFATSVVLHRLYR